MTLRDRLHALHPSASGRTIKQWLEAGRVRVNGAVVRRGDVELSEDDHVDLTGRGAPRFPAPLRPVHEDADILVVDKPPGLLTIATERERARTAYRLLADYVAAGRAGRLFIVHRLDRDTSGLVVFAKSATAKRALQEQFARHLAERRYVALVEGVVREEEGTLRKRLVEDAVLRVRPTRDPRRGREAITRFRVLRRGRATTLLELTLVTGRRGQIRASLAALGHPIAGDARYGSRLDPARRLCLHATHLGFVHPRGERVTYTSPVPLSFAAR